MLAAYQADDNSNNSDMDRSGKYTTNRTRSSGNENEIEKRKSEGDDHAQFTVMPEQLADELVDAAESLPDLERIAQTSNPSLRRILQEYRAARAKVGYVDKLPDPTIGGNVFLHPIETAAGSQRANFALSQMLPWLPRLDAQAQQACFEALAMYQVYSAERLKVIGDVRAAWYRIYVVDRQIKSSKANQVLLESLIKVANSRISTGKAALGDVLLATLEYSKLEEQLLTLRQQRESTVAEFNRLLGREVATPVHGPHDLDVTLPDWSQPMLHQLAWKNQPDIEAAKIRVQATSYGMEVARLKRRPDFSVSAAWYAIDDNRPASMIVDVGRDAWSVGASMSIPLWHGKYDAMEDEASWKHAASHSSVEETIERYDAILLDLWQQAKAADETVKLYRDTIIPQAQQTLDADQMSYTNGKVEFDRVVIDFRNLVTLELGYHQAIGRLATAIARIQQATGTE